jgi:hypothetical protein
VALRITKGTVSSTYMHGGEALIEARPACAATMRPLIEELRTKQANLRRLAQRKAQSARAVELPGVESYRAAVTDLAEVLAGSNVEAARTQLRGPRGHRAGLRRREKALWPHRVKSRTALTLN